MPSNTSVHDLLDFINRLGCIHKARAAEFELSHYREHGELPDGAEHIARVYIVNGSELVELKSHP